MPQTMMNIPNVVFREFAPHRLLAANRSVDQAHAPPCAAALGALHILVRYSLPPVIMRQMCDA
jgi:hypothetical protein